MTTRVMNFSAGPAALPLPALERAQRELLDFAGTGMSVMEQSHRGKDYEAVHDEALALLREVLRVPASHEIVFVQGGATQQFAQIPMNFLPRGGKADHLVTGAFGEKAVEEAQAAASLVGGEVRVVASTGAGAKPAYTRLPTADEMRLDGTAAYVHYTSNETINGVQFANQPGASYPDFGRVPVVCDMSSEFLSRPFDVSPFSFIYAGAQKNIGPSGLVVAIARKDFLEGSRQDLPRIFQYRAFVENKSLLNTPPTFAIYLVRNVLAWVKEKGGLEAIEKRNREKARLLYDAVDARPDFFRCPVDRAARSIMNVVFRLPTPALEDTFFKEASLAHLVGIKGHRSVGGVRVSLYNAVEVEWARALVDFMENFAKKQG
ncbi:MAG TPA: 3-phosphoserine/phosphohydroxythreonine transaminase [Polyangiaceae bacterium]